MKMLPSLPKSTSRRSSILKIPKSRSSLHNGTDLPTPVMDNTPTPKLKRRVSFAEKKHVKEFCDSIEQGTLWDSTYEESESSQTKSNQSDKFAEVNETSTVNDYYELQVSKNIIATASSSVSETVIAQSQRQLTYINSADTQLLFATNSISNDVASTRPQFLDDKENIPSALQISSDSLVDEEELTVNQYKNIHSNSLGFTIYCDDDDDNVSEDKENPLNTTNHADVSMDCTLVATDSLLSACTSNWNNVIVTDNTNKAVNNTPEIVKVQEINSEIAQNTKVFQDSRLVPTKVTESACALNASAVQPQLNATAFGNKSMEFTECIRNSNNRQVIMPEQSVPLRRSLLPVPIHYKNKQVFSNERKKMTEAVDALGSSKNANRFIKETTQVFHNKSMEITAINSEGSYKNSNHFIEKKTQAFHDKAMGMTEAAISDGFAKYSKCIDKERTKVFQNKSMEITEAINSKGSNNLNPFIAEKSQVLPNKSMEMTKAINPIGSKNLNLLIQDKTQVFHNKSMELTQAINPIGSGDLSRFLEDKTQVFHNKSMEMTGSIIPAGSKRLNRFIGENTQLHDKSMEMTAAINPVGSKNLNHFVGEKTQIFPNKSMEMTEAINPVGSLKNLNRFIEEKTQLFYNKSMEITEAVNVGGFVKNPNCTNGERTKVFHNKSEEITKTLDSAALYEQSHCLGDGKTQVFHDKSMEMTGVIHSTNISNKLHQNDGSKTQVFHDQFMEPTEVVQSAGLSNQLQQAGSDKIQVYPDKSINTIKTANVPDKLKNFSNEKTQIFHNKSMEITEVISRSNQCSAEPGVCNHELSQCHNKCVTKNIIISAGLSNPEKNIFADENAVSNNKVVEMPLNGSIELSKTVFRAIPHQTSTNMNQDAVNSTSNVEIDHNYFMELTEAIPSLKRHYDTIAMEDKSSSVPSIPNAKYSRNSVGQRKPSEKDLEALHRLLHRNLDEDYSSISEKSPVPNYSQEITAAINSPLNTHNNEDGDKMEMTEAISSLGQQQNIGDAIEDIVSTSKETLGASEPSKQPITNIFDVLKQTINQLDQINLPLDVTQPPIPSLRRRQSVDDATENIASISEETLGASAPLKQSSINILDASKQTTQVFNNKSMEMTEIMNPVSSSKNADRFIDENTQVFHNKSMEMTKAINSAGFCENSNQLIEETTQVFHDKSMNMTAAIISDGFAKLKQTVDDAIENIASTIEENLGASEPSKQLSINILDASKQITQVFHNKSMEMTEAINSAGSCENSNQFIEETTQVFHDKSMNMTAAIISDGFAKLKQTVDDAIENIASTTEENLGASEPSKQLSINILDASKQITQVFHNKSMEMTEAINPVGSYKNSNQFIEGKTQVFHDKSMEMIAAVISEGLTKFKQTVDNAIENIASTSEETLGASEPSKQSSINILAASKQITQEFDNKSMEMTEIMNPVGSSKNANRFIDEETQVFHNKSMEMTEAINPVGSYKNSNQFIEEKTQVFHDKSMEMTAAVISDRSAKLKQTVDDTIENIASTTEENLRASEPSKQSLIGTLDASKQAVNQSNQIDVPPDVIESSESSNQNSSNSFFSNLPDDDLLADINLIETGRGRIEKSKCNSRVKGDILISPAKQPMSSEEIKETSIPNSMKNMGNPTEKIRHQYIGDAGDDITYDMTKPIVRRKEIEEVRDVTVSILPHKRIDDFSLHLVEAPSFIYDQSLTNSKTDYENMLRNELCLPNVSLTSPIDPTNTDENEDNNDRCSAISRLAIDNVSNRNVTAQVHCVDKAEQKHLDQNIDVATSSGETNNTNGVLANVSSKTFVIRRKRKSDEDINKLLNVCPAVNATVGIEKIGQRYSQSNFKLLRLDCKQTNYKKIISRANLINSGSGEHYEMHKKNATTVMNSEEFSANTHQAYDKLIKIDCHENKNDGHNAVLTKPKSKYLKALESASEEYATIMKKVLKTNETEELYAKENMRIMKNINNREKQRDCKDVSEAGSSTGIINKSPYEILEEDLRSIEKQDCCIWQIYKLTPELVCIDYFKTALLLLIRLRTPKSIDEIEKIESIKLISRLRDDESELLKMTDRLIIQSIDTNCIKGKYKLYDDIPKVITDITNEVTFFYNFYDDVYKLSRCYLMDITEDKISFNLRTNRTTIILRISIDLKSFPRISPENVDVVCIVGSIKEDDVKKLIAYVKPTSKIISLYIKNAEDLLNLLEETELIKRRTIIYK